MSSKWRVIDCSALEGSIKPVRGGVAIEKDGNTTTVPVADVAVMLIGPGCDFSTGTIHRLTDADVAVLFCDWRGIPEAAAYSWSKHTRITSRRRAQSQLSSPRQKNAWMRIIRRKIQNQSRALKLCEVPGSGLLTELAKQVKSGDPSNVEGQSARAYWSSLFGSDFTRIPGSRAGINGMLDYAYGIVRGHGIRAVLAAGLEPSLGVHHRGRSNMFCLVDDLIEIFRPVVDYHIYRLVSEGVEQVEDAKAELVQIASSAYRKDGATIPTVFEDLAQSFGKYAEGDTEKLNVPKWDSEP